MIEIYWNRAIGIKDGKSEILKFPENEEKLIEIFQNLRNGDFSFLGEFLNEYGPDIELKTSIMDDKFQKILINYGKYLLNSSDKSELKIMESVKFYHSLEKIINDYKNHLQDWYEVFDPHSKFLYQEDKYLKKILENDLNMEDNDKNIISEMIKIYRNLESLKKGIENYIETVMKIKYPNLESIAGPILGAELILLSNGIKNLANSPAGRIQILGAGKAFYISRKKNVPGPKHGIIFKHPFVHSSKERGKRARILAGKIAIAARIDYYRGSENKDFIEKAKKNFSKTIK
ncbi:MAG: hypothetical protein ACP5F1_02630 [Thermoplasmata archaeon]